ncbi:hypothetical protein SFRURICE_016227 [Spodoptera frugiperda]|nr:hypothetical protein SFRURICE_016227 [Spodoptera frugiperda]
MCILAAILRNYYRMYFPGMAGAYQGVRTYKEPLLSSLEEDESSDGVVEVEPSFIQLEIMDNDFRRNPLIICKSNG